MERKLLTDNEYPFNLAVFINERCNNDDMPDNWELRLNNALESLTDRMKTVLLLRWKDHKSYRQIASMLELTMERIRQIELKALYKCKRAWKLNCEREKAKANCVNDDEIEEIDIEELDFTARLRNCLWFAKIKTSRDIVAKKPSEIRKLRNLGEKSYNELKEEMAYFGIVANEEIDMWVWESV